ncbi:ribonuclease p/mrp subunit, putative [Aspergillus udagawae]|uniref:Ribonuclease p/mrp subunit, putative n=1 Tax=Aspergillus udagawae TaxID=91492 RepID=A0ABQ1BF48_9EURO|nr:ribonuclease p/mrp subunit, putative [Aspergillus udagawae]
MKNILKVVYQPDTNITSDIVFIHGLGGGPESTWLHERNQRFWPSGLQNFFPASRVLTYGYAADFATFFPSPSDANSRTDIKQHATVLLHALVELREASKTDSKAIVFIAHSLGGLICANALVNSDSEYSNIIRNTRGLIFMGTPFGAPNEDDTTVWTEIAERFLTLYETGNEDAHFELDKRV